MLRLLKTTNPTNPSTIKPKRGIFWYLMRFSCQCLAILLIMASCYAIAAWLFGASSTFNLLKTTNTTLKPWLMLIHFIVWVLLFIKWQTVVDWYAKRHNAPTSALLKMYDQRTRICLLILITQMLFVYQPWQWF